MPPRILRRNDRNRRWVAVLALALLSSLLCGGVGFAAYTNNILLTGYWPPTGGEGGMLNQWLYDPYNPETWQGANWNNSGFDVYALYPTFPGGTGSNPRGDGFFEIHYDSVYEDFAGVTTTGMWVDHSLTEDPVWMDPLNPVAILSYGQGNGPWEIEHNARNLTRRNWYRTSYSGRPDQKPDLTLPNNETLSASDLSSDMATLYQNVEDAVNAANLPGIGTGGAWVDWNGNPGAFLCEYMAFLGLDYYYWNGPDAAEYDPDAPPYENDYTVYATSFTHLGGNVPVSSGATATEISLDETIWFLSNTLPPGNPAPIPSSAWLLGSALLFLLRLSRKA